MDVISQVVLVGAGTRMPKVQDKLMDVVKTELSKNINTDEAAVLGAVYKAADLSQGFKVKKFITKDAVLFPIQIVFGRTVDGKTKQVRKTLFSKMNAYPQKKIITFNKHKDDFGFEVNYAELDHLPEEELSALGHLRLSNVMLIGVADALKKHTEQGAESKGIRAHFAMDDSGLLNLHNVELVSEKTSQPWMDEEEGTFSKLGSTISKLFSGSDENDLAEKVEVTPKEDFKSANEESPEYANLNLNAGEKSNDQNKTRNNDAKSVNQTENVEKKPTVITLKEKIDSIENKQGSQMLLDEKLKESRDKIKALNLYDLERNHRETVLNNLESFVIDAQHKMASTEYIAAASPDEAEKIVKMCSDILEWLYEGGFDATAETFEQKLMSLKKLTDGLYEKVFEHRERPDALQGMLSIIHGSTVFLNNMKNLTDSNEIFTSVEIQSLEKVINETQEYHDKIVKSISETPLHEPVKYKVRDIGNKMAVLDREVKYLVNKAKIWKPKQDTEKQGSTNDSKTIPDETPKEESTSASKSHVNVDEIITASEDPAANADYSKGELKNNSHGTDYMQSSSGKAEPDNISSTDEESDDTIHQEL